MAISKGKSSVCLEDIISKVSEIEILAFYLGIFKIPCVIHSPFREDKKPSFGLYSNDYKRIHYIDYATKERGGLFDLLSKLWRINYIDVLHKISLDIDKMHSVCTIYNVKPKIVSSSKSNSNSDLQCKIREWRNYDLNYWESYGISLKWLKYADVYPVSHIIIIKEDNKYIINADKYAYAYVERKEEKITLKIYQPFNKTGHKWANKHDKSVISLWTKVPEYGDKICICSSLKDALCLWSNLNIPSISIQGEGYGISDTAINELRRRYKNIYICLDNDEVGIKDAVKLAEDTHFTNIVIPKFNGGKDISDLMKVKGKEEFINILYPLFNLENTGNNFSLS